MTSAPAVVLVGPVPPWRSGIADQTIRLARAMAKLGVAPRVLTFRRMYPGALYPGKSDRGTGAFPDDLEVDAILDGTRPFSFRRAARAAVGARLVVLPWWTAFWAPHDVLFLRELRSLSPSSLRLLLCHNLVDHEGGTVKRALARAVFRQADVLSVQNRREREAMEGRFPGRKVELIPHPSEPREVLPDRDGARARLGIPPGVPLFLFTGILRPYKGWDVLLAALPALHRESPEALVAFVGEPWGDARELPGRIPKGERVRLELRYLDEHERALWLDACDAVVCPYRHATGSGIAADAFAHGRPVIGTEVDGLVDVIEDGVTGLLVPPENPDALAAAMGRFVRDGLGPRLSANVVTHRARFHPETHARQVLRLGGIDV